MRGSLRWDEHTSSMLGDAFSSLRVSFSDFLITADSIGLAREVKALAPNVESLEISEQTRGLTLRDLIEAGGVLAPPEGIPDELQDFPVLNQHGVTLRVSWWPGASPKEQGASEEEQVEIEQQIQGAFRRYEVLSSPGWSLGQTHVIDVEKFADPDLDPSKLGPLLDGVLQSAQAVGTALGGLRIRHTEVVREEAPPQMD